MFWIFLEIKSGFVLHFKFCQRLDYEKKKKKDFSLSFVIFIPTNKSDTIFF